ncbi:MAG: FAD:protein FMN transferase [Solirubrobacteraceae bacterium]
MSAPSSEAGRRFDCFGSECGAWVIGASGAGSAVDGVDMVERCLRRWHRQFTRFSPDSELSRLNSDPRAEVPVSAMMARFVKAAIDVAELTGGLVDATLIGALERAGYREDLAAPVPLTQTLTLAPPRAPGRASPAARWRQLKLQGRLVTRPPGLRLDSGGVAKGMFADLLADVLARAQSYAVDCGGDLRVGGEAGVERAVEVLGPADDAVIHVWKLCSGAAATSGIGKRSWLDGEGAPAHHLLDPLTGRPAFTGIVQATALAPTALEAEARSKAALLAGPEAAARWLPHGGLIVFEDLSSEVLAQPAAA